MLAWVTIMGLKLLELLSKSASLPRLAAAVKKVLVKLDSADALHRLSSSNDTEVAPISRLGHLPLSHH